MGVSNNQHPLVGRLEQPHGLITDRLQQGEGDCCFPSHPSRAGGDNTPFCGDPSLSLELHTGWEQSQCRTPNPPSALMGWGHSSVPDKL